MKLSVRRTKGHYPKLKQAARKAEREVAQAVKRHAIRLLSGHHTSQELRRRDHPFARRHGTARLPVLPINKQTGALQKSARIVKQANGTVFYFAHAHAIVLNTGGTKRMLTREFWPELVRRSRPELTKALNRLRAEFPGGRFGGSVTVRR